MYALHQDHNDWYRIRNQVSGPTQLFIYDEIGYFGVGAGDLVRDLADIPGAVEVHLNSPGGEVWDGITIYNTLLSRKDVTVIIDGLAASIASVIACAGNPTLIAKQGQVVIHDGFCMAIGNAQDMRDTADKLDRASTIISGVYAERTGKPAEAWRKLMQVETTFNAQEAIDSGLVDRFLDNGAQRPGAGAVSGDWDLSGLFRQGAQLLDAASVPFVGREQHRHAPMTGRHVHDHNAFGASDHDDGSHSHVHSHRNDATHDHTHDGTEAGERDGRDSDWGYNDVRLLEHVMNSAFTGTGDIMAWDAAAAYAKCKTASDFKSIAFEKSNDSSPDTAAHYGLPHHATPGGPPDKGGVVAAIGRSNQVEGLKNKAGAIAHLKAHARTLGLPSGDGDSDSWMEPSDQDVKQFLEALKGA
jgi:ATP-dependent protease ClpP protease subunit